MKGLNGITTNSASTMPYPQLIKDQSSINPSPSSIALTSTQNKSPLEKTREFICSFLCDNGINDSNEFTQEEYNKATHQLIQQAVNVNALAFKSLSFNINDFEIKVIFFDTQEALDAYSGTISAPAGSYCNITLKEDIFCYKRREQIMTSYRFAFDDFSEYTQLYNRIFNKPEPHEGEERRAYDILFLKALKHLCRAYELKSSLIHNLDGHQGEFAIITLEGECNTTGDEGKQCSTGNNDQPCELQRDTNLPARFNIKIKESHGTNSNDASTHSTRESSSFKQSNKLYEFHKDIDVKEKAPDHNEKVITEHNSIIQDSQKGMSKVQSSKVFLKNCIDFTKETYKVFCGYFNNIKEHVSVLFKKITTKKV